MADPRQPGQLGVAAEDEVAQGAAGEVGGADAVADVPARPAEPGLAVEPDRGAPVARDAERAAPRVGDPGAGEHREEVDQGGVEPGEDPLVAVVLRLDPRAEVVRRAAAAEDQPVVGGALAVDDQVAVVGERLAPGQADLVPDLGAAAARWR